jgi:hypothetical protein
MMVWGTLGIAGLLGCGEKGLTGDSPMQPRDPPPGTDAATDAGTDAATTDPQPDAGMPAALSVPVSLIPDTIDAVDLAADANGLYWLTSTDELWMLPTGATAPQRLSPGGGAISTRCPGAEAPQLATTATDVFWIGRQPSAVRRTSKDGATDVILANALSSPSTLAVDDTRVYWSEDANLYGGCQGSGYIATLLQSAAPGTAPTSLAWVQGEQDIDTLAVKGGSLYWVAFDSVGSTIYQGAWIWTAPVSALLARAATPTMLSFSNLPYALFPSGQKMYFAYVAGQVPWATGLAEFTRDEGPLEDLAYFPDATITSVTVLDGDWLAVSVSGTAPNGGAEGQLYVAPISGAGMTLAAVGLETNAVAGPTGATFVDTSGHLMVLPLPASPGADVQRPIAFGSRR